MLSVSTKTGRARNGGDHGDPRPIVYQGTHHFYGGAAVFASRPDIGCPRIGTTKTNKPRRRCYDALKPVPRIQRLGVPLAAAKRML